MIRITFDLLPGGDETRARADHERTEAALAAAQAGEGRAS